MSWRIKHLKHRLGDSLDVTEMPNRTAAARGRFAPAATATPAGQGAHRRNVLIWLVAMFALTVAAGLFVYGSVNRFADEAARVEHSHEVIRVAEQTFSDLKDAESTGRGFVLTGNPALLAQFYVSQQHVREGHARLKSLVSDDPAQARRVQELSAEMESKLDYSASVVEARRTEGFEAAQSLALKGRGPVAMEGVRRAVAEVVADEQRLLAERNEKARATGREVVTVIILGGFVSLSIIVIVYFLIRREALLRHEVERGLEESNSKLHAGLGEMERLTNEVYALNSMGELLQSCTSAAEAADVVGRVAPLVLPDTAATLCTIKPSKNHVEASALWGKAAGHEAVFAPDECWALRRGRVHCARQGSHEPACAKLACPSRGGDMCVPLVAHGETLGVIHLGAQEAGALDGSKHVVRSLTEQFSLTLANLRLQETLRAQSIRDPLTGLFNRRYMEASLERELLRAGRQELAVGVIMLDVDHFKRFNDTFGHAAGDAVLQELGGVLRANLRGEDIACRYGGEEFLLILPGAGAEAAAQRAEQIRRAVGALRVAHRGQQLGPVTASLGVVAYPAHGENMDELIRRSDAALYLAKKAGRDRVVLDGETAGGRERRPAALQLASAWAAVPAALTEVKDV